MNENKSIKSSLVREGNENITDRISKKTIVETIKRDIPFNAMIKDSGIYETKPLINNITVGVSYETNEETNQEVCYYNIFNDEEYIDGCGLCPKSEEITPQIIENIKKKINNLL